MDAASPPEWITFTGLRTQFGISRSMGSRLIAAGLVDARKLGGRVLICVSSVRQYLSRLLHPAIKPDEKSDRLAAKSLAAT